MSAYALPGLFPPVDNTFGFSLNKPCPLDDIHSLAKEEKIEFEPLEMCEPTASVSVKDAKVDPLLLIQSLTKKTWNVSSKRTSLRRQIRRRNASGLFSTHSPQEAAMEFELEVYQDGRCYAATRSLARIRKLRAGLVKEAELMNNGLCPRSYQVKIPQVPRLQEECSSLGFTLLQDVLRCYSPALEKWFQDVLKEFPTPQLSPSLSDFLYEPTFQTNWENVLFRPRKAAPSRLDSIEESDSEDEEKQEE